MLDDGRLRFDDSQRRFPTRAQASRTMKRGEAAGTPPCAAELWAAPLFPAVDVISVLLISADWRRKLMVGKG